MLTKRFFIVWGLILATLLPATAFAQEGLDGIAENIGSSTTTLPGMIAGIAYLSGILFAVLAIFKTIDHVSNPTQTPLRIPVVRYLVGGGLFALPTIITAARNTISGGGVANFDPDTGFIATVSGVAGLTAYIGLGNFNSILNSVVFTSERLPALVAVVAYLLGLIMAISALYKTRDHVDDPDRSPLKDAVIRYITAGALFALPNIYDAVYNTITDGGVGIGTAIFEGYLLDGFIQSTELGGLFAGIGSVACDPLAAAFPLFFSSGGVGETICIAMYSVSGLPYFLTLISYMLGLVIGLWAILKIRDHVINPSQTALSEGVSRLIVSGLFFGLPVVSMALAYSVTPIASGASTLIAGSNTGFENGGLPLLCGTLATAPYSLDQAMACFMAEMLGPIHVFLNFFGYIAGLIFIMIGISRLMKSSQDGARGPGGLGTVGTFTTGAVLISAPTLIHSMSTSLFGTTITATKAKLTYTTGMSITEKAAAYNVINSVLQFMIIIGLISFVRGIFIMRDVTEGNQQASAMSGITHIVGGALAVNLGPVLNAIQTTLGINAFGVTFS